MPGSEESDDGRIDHRLPGVRKSFVDHKRYSQAERPEKLQRRQVRGPPVAVIPVALRESPIPSAQDSLRAHVVPQP